MGTSSWPSMASDDVLLVPCRQTTTEERVSTGKEKRKETTEEKDKSIDGVDGTERIGRSFGWWVRCGIQGGALVGWIRQEEVSRGIWNVAAAELD